MTSSHTRKRVTVTTLTRITAKASISWGIFDPYLGNLRSLPGESSILTWGIFDPYLGNLRSLPGGSSILTWGIFDPYLGDLRSLPGGSSILTCREVYMWPDELLRPLRPLRIDAFCGAIRSARALRNV